MEARDAEGYVFRTDLRLRPDPAVTPPAVSLPAAHHLLRKHGPELGARGHDQGAPGGRRSARPVRRSWRRSGRSSGAAVWISPRWPTSTRMKRRIDAHKAGTRGVRPGRAFAGHNVKLGQGGIREIEFLVQTLQMVWGGRDPVLRDRTTLGALAAAGRAPGTWTASAARELAAAYRFLRRVEHRLQMVADRQTHTPAGAGRTSWSGSPCSWGIATPAAFAADLLGPSRPGARALRRGVRARSRPMPAHADAAGLLDFRGDDPCPAGTVAALRAARLRRTPVRIVAAVRGWQAGRVRALALAAGARICWTDAAGDAGGAGAAAQPDAAFSRFDAFLAAPAGAACSCCRCSSAIRRCSTGVAAVLGAGAVAGRASGASPRRRWKGCCRRRASRPIRPRCCATRLRDARRLEDVIAIVRRTVREEDFAISVGHDGGPARRRRGRAAADRAGRRGAGGAAAAGAGAISPQRYGRVPRRARWRWWRWARPAGGR